jgi:hypothetical protein
LELSARRRGGDMGMRPVVEMQFIDFIANAYDISPTTSLRRYRAFLPSHGGSRTERRYVRGGPFIHRTGAGFVHTPV